MGTVDGRAPGGSETGRVVVLGARTAVLGVLERHLAPRVVVPQDRDRDLGVPGAGGAGLVLAAGVGADLPVEQQRERLLDGTADLLARVRSGELSRLVVVTSTAVYGALPDNPVPLEEDGPLRAAPGPSRIGNLVAVEEMVAAARLERPEDDIVVLRVASLLAPGTDGVLAQHLAGPRMLFVRGSSPVWQVCSLEDLMAAVAAVLALPPGALSGPAVVASRGQLDQAELEALTGRSRMELPAAVAEATAARLRRSRLSASASEDLALLRWPWVVAPRRLAALGWQPSESASDAVAGFLSALSAPSEGAGRTRAGAPAVTVAGATVAAVGTAALIRQVRRRRGR